MNLDSELIIKQQEGYPGHGLWKFTFIRTHFIARIRNRVQLSQNDSAESRYATLGLSPPKRWRGLEMGGAMGAIGWATRSPSFHCYACPHFYLGFASAIVHL